MIIAFGEHMCDVDGLTTLGINHQGIFYITRNNFVMELQWNDPVCCYRPPEKFCYFVTYNGGKGRGTSCYREYHLGNVVFILEYKAPKMAHKVSELEQMHSLTPKVNLKRILKAIFR